MPNIRVITIENATIKYGRRVLFNGLNFEIKKNEHWAIIGKNGSGKSALLRTLAGKNFISKGRILRHYEDEYRKSHPVRDPLFPYRRPLAWVPAKNDLIDQKAQDFYYQQRFNAVYADDALTVEEYLQNIAEREKPGGQWTLGDVYETFNLAALGKKHLLKLSHGESKRLRVGGALLKNPRLLLLDNPFAGLDAGTRDEFENIFRQIARSGISIVMVTSPHEIPRAITHVAVLGRNKKLNVCERKAFTPALEEAPCREMIDTVGLRRLMGEREPLPGDVLVSMKKVRVAYGDVLVLDNVSWEIKQGQRWALSGPNGSGKSTLLSLIYGDHPQAYANEIALFNRKRGTGDTIWDIKKKIGFMSPELHQYFPHNFTCQQVVESGFYDTIGLFSKSRPENREIASRWMEILDLSGIQEAALCEVSTSQQRRCLLARALVKNPYLLLLDEPCIGFDRQQQQKFKNIVDGMAQTGDLTLVYVTHQQETLPGCITHTMVL